jgi:hypothetical protein
MKIVFVTTSILLLSTQAFAQNDSTKALADQGSTNSASARADAAAYEAQAAYDILEMNLVLINRPEGQRKKILALTIDASDAKDNERRLLARVQNVVLRRKRCKFRLRSKKTLWKTVTVS